MIFDSDWLVRDPSIDEKGKFLVKHAKEKRNSAPEPDRRVARARPAPGNACRLALAAKLA